MNHGHTQHDGAEINEGPAGYNGLKGPSKSDLYLPTKVYPSSSKLGQGDKNKEIIEGPGCEGRGGYHRK
jgi:hypothetical protein